MNRIATFREVIWPVLEPWTAEQLSAQADSFDKHRELIATLDFGDSADVALEEARRYADGEEDRRRTADQKATTYLAVVAALVPLILAVATAIWDKKAGSAPTWCNMLMLGAAVLYICGAGLWAFRVLEVSSSSRIGASDFHTIWTKPDPTEKLARQIIFYTRFNHDGVNKKVNGIKMAHAFLLRAFFTFAFLMLFNISWYLFGAAFTWITEIDWYNSASSIYNRVSGWGDCPAT